MLSFPSQRLRRGVHQYEICTPLGDGVCQGRRCRPPCEAFVSQFEDTGIALQGLAQRQGILKHRFWNLTDIYPLVPIDNGRQAERGEYPASRQTTVEARFLIAARTAVVPESGVCAVRTADEDVIHAADSNDDHFRVYEALVVRREMLLVEALRVEDLDFGFSRECGRRKEFLLRIDQQHRFARLKCGPHSLKSREIFIPVRRENDQPFDSACRSDEIHELRGKTYSSTRSQKCRLCSVRKIDDAIGGGVDIEPTRTFARPAQFVVYCLAAQVLLVKKPNCIVPARQNELTLATAEDRGEPVRILYATHSWAGAEFVDNEMRKIDVRDVFKVRDDGSTIDVFPLLTLAQRHDYSQIGFRPLGIDSSDGKKQALAEIAEVIAAFVTTDWIAYKAGASQEFQNHVESAKTSKENKLFCWDLLIEFGCVIAAHGILTRTADLQKYVRVKRMRWMMPLPNNAEKEAVFRMWGIFVERLRSRYLLSSDQIIFDSLSDLGTFFWESARRKEGYDVIFVDEMHLFNSQERLIFHNLLRNPDSPPRVVMALDPKQSPRETFVEVKAEGADSKINIYNQARLPNPESIDLTEVYRYTPEINELIKSLHEVVPALDLPQDWDIPVGHSHIDGGEKPSYQIFPNTLAIFKAAIGAARKLSRAAAKRNGRVSILCLDEEKFDEYAKAAEGQNAAEVFIIASRDDTERLRYSGKRFLLSTPEYVAGLQFDTVILIDANRDRVPEGQNTGYLMRRFLSELYLGVSRAERRLVIFANKDAGGLTPLLRSAVEQKLIVETNVF
jgi:hypothetical protein